MNKFKFSFGKPNTIFVSKKEYEDITKGYKMYPLIKVNEGALHNTESKGS
jgi:hypothetical protein